MSTFLALPLELQEQVATYLIPCEVASLARVSRDTYRVFGPILYRAVAYPRNPLVVLDLLGKSTILAGAVRALSIDYETPDEPPAWQESSSDAQAKIEGKDKQDAATASSALERLGSSESHLVSLAWRSDLLLSKLSSMLCAPGRFQSLKELTVHPENTKWPDWDYDFLGLPLLEYLDFRQEFYDCDSSVLRIAKKLGKSINSIQSEVSKLQTLKFHVVLPASHETEKAMKMIASAINKLRLPRVREAWLYVSDRWEYGADFGPFVDVHPFLSYIAFDFRGFSLKTDQLPVLKSFHGSPTDCAHILLGHRSVLQMTVWAEEGGELPTLTREDDEWYETDDLVSFLEQNRSVERLTVLPTPDRGETIEIDDDLSCLDTDYITRLVKACPQIQHLELSVDHGPAYLLSSVFHRLAELQTIKLHYKDIIEPREETDYSDAGGGASGIVPLSPSPEPFPFGAEHDPYHDDTPRTVFPPEKYVAAIKTMTEKATKLREVSLHLRAWIGENDWYERDLTRDLGDPAYEIEYTFYVDVSSEGKKTLVRVVVESEHVSVSDEESTSAEADDEGGAK